MKALNITDFVFKFTDKAKPVLSKLLPVEWLRAVKKIMVQRCVDKIGNNAFKKLGSHSLLDGVNLIGYIKGEIGLGQSMRLLARALDASDFPFTIYNYQQVSVMRFGDSEWDSKITNTVPYNINIFHINPYELPIAFSRLGRKVWDSRYNIGFWLWELEQFPESWIPSINLVDEIWTPSDFSAAAIKKVTDKPVYTMPYPLTAPADTEFGRSFFGLPEEKYLYLVMYDSNSTMERKNPLGAVRAFKTAFAPDDKSVGLVLKINNAQKKDLDIIQKEILGYKNIYQIAEILSKIQVNSLIACADVFVSLHRAEGFGLPLAEAMLIGTPVIATNWSSTTEFMSQDKACLVDFEFVEIKKQVGAYEKGQRWAEPDVGQAAQYMRRLFEDRAYAAQQAKKAQDYISDKLSVSRAVGKVNARVLGIYNCLQRS
ncbi:MAG: glycosyltransferase [Spirochaetaceae bacterium]|jgi:glycosyltransferase involved in cell wall biosynthesis|nr:glycosyltransferase [Spirochaetaceae bacterium]